MKYVEDFCCDGCGRALPAYPAFSDTKAYCTMTCRTWFEPDWHEDEDEDDEA